MILAFVFNAIPALAENVFAFLTPLSKALSDFVIEKMAEKKPLREQRNMERRVWRVRRACKRFYNNNDSLNLTRQYLQSKVDIEFADLPALQKDIVENLYLDITEGE